MVGSLVASVICDSFVMTDYFLFFHFHLLRKFQHHYKQQVRNHIN